MQYNWYNWCRLQYANWYNHRSQEREAPLYIKLVYIRALPKQGFDPPCCAHSGTLWHLFFAENKKILKTAILTLGMNILTVTVVKHDSGMVF